MIFAVGGETFKEYFALFFKNYVLCISLGAAGIIIVTILIVFIIKNERKKKKEIIAKSDNELVSLLGGKDNIISYEQAGSRINLSCKDYIKVNLGGLKAYGISSSIKMSDKLILVSENARKFIKTIEKSI